MPDLINNQNTLSFTVTKPFLPSRTPYHYNHQQLQPSSSTTPTSRTIPSIFRRRARTRLPAIPDRLTTSTMVQMQRYQPNPTKLQQHQHLVPSTFPSTAHPKLSRKYSGVQKRSRSCTAVTSASVFPHSASSSNPKHMSTCKQPYHRIRLRLHLQTSNVNTLSALLSYHYKRPTVIPNVPSTLLNMLPKFARPSWQPNGSLQLPNFEFSKTATAISSCSNISTTSTTKSINTGIPTTLDLTAPRTSCITSCSSSSVAIDSQSPSIKNTEYLESEKLDW